MRPIIFVFYGGDTVSILDELTPEELLTTTNYPGIENYYSTIDDIVVFAEKVSIALQAYNNELTEYIDILVADVRKYITKIRTLNNNLGKLENIPHHLIQQLREIHVQLALLASYPQYFKENYQPELEVEADD